MDLAILIIVGAMAGILAGLLGIGGGALIVPVLAIVFESQGVSSEVTMRAALATSLATIVFTAFSSSLAHHRRGAVDWKLVASLSPALVIGTLLGTYFADQLSNITLKVIFIVFMFAIALQMAFGSNAARAKAKLPGISGLSTAGALTGTASALFGIGGGSLIIPFLTFCSLPVKRAVAVGAAIGIPVALSGSLGYIISGWSAPDRPAGSLGYVVVPVFAGIVVASMLAAPLGARLAHKLKPATLRRVFAVALSLLGLRMLWSML